MQDTIFYKFRTSFTDMAADNTYTSIKLTIPIKELYSFHYNHVLISYKKRTSNKCKNKREHEIYILKFERGTI